MTLVIQLRRRNRGCLQLLPNRPGSCSDLDIIRMLGYSILQLPEAAPEYNPHLQGLSHGLFGILGDRIHQRAQHLAILISVETIALAICCSVAERYAALCQRLDKWPDHVDWAHLFSRVVAATSALQNTAVLLVLTLRQS